ncbi:TonB-dependent receptor [Dyadobacter tibetensis]|uniref:TonB-dependent receptor n=1 Tax=Dyadobacter tibetensis TaxID=1211851 RepID=UPI0004AE478C|nr:TonB-dependent receptor [Dyadobacter tibetensis]
MEKLRQVLRLLRVVMKISLPQFLLIALFAGICLAKPVEAQTSLDQKISIHTGNVYLKQALNEIQKKANIRFTYSSAIIPARQKVTLDMDDKPLSEVLHHLFSPLHVNYSVKGNQIILRQKESVPSKVEPLTVVRKMAERLVKGTVKDAQGEPLPGVSVKLMGSLLGTITDPEGAFQLLVPEKDGTLLFSFVGFEAKEIPFSNQSILEVVLQADIKALNEVVVIGYGTQKKGNVTGAVTTVKMDEIVGDRPTNNTAQALQGAIPGLQIAPSTGKPGDTAGLQIRGFESINGGNPLVLVDNVPMNINDINPRDIETVTVLKDAAASAIYGGRAAFGVVLITTKQGKRNQPIKFDYSTNIAVSSAVSLPEKVSALQFAQTLQDYGQTRYYTGQVLTDWVGYLNDYKVNPSKYPNGIAVDANNQEYPLREHDLVKDFMGKGFEQLHNLSFSGGSENSSYRVSMGYSNEDGIMVTDKDNFKKFNVNALLNTQLTRKLESSINVFYKNQQQQTPYGTQNIFRIASTYGNFNGQGYREMSDGRSIPYYTPYNLLQLEPAIKNFGDNLRLFGKLTYEPIANLKINGEYTFSKTGNNTREYNANNAYISAPIEVYQFNTRTRYFRSTANTDYHAVNLYGNYQKSFGPHILDFTAGTNYENSRYETFSAARLDVFSAQVPSLSTADNANMTNGDGFSEYAIMGAFGRVAYNYQDKYLFEANGRYDGSSRFAKTNRYGFFPSFSAGWVLSEESFMKPLQPIVSNLKIRASWGEIGNQVVGNDYPYIPGMNSTQASWINYDTNLRPITLSPPSLVSANFTWETVRSANLGLDVTLLKGKMNTSIDLFKRQTLNMLRQGVELPAVLGTSAPLQNVADLESKGWEWNVSWKERHGDFSYSVGFNLSDNKAFITKIQNESGNINDPYYNGYQIGQIWGYETDGFYTANDFNEGTLDDRLMIKTLANHLKDGLPRVEGVFHNPGDVRYVDLNGDGIINPGNNTLENPGDRKIIGNSNRRFQYGLNAHLAYKGFDLSLFAQGVGKRDLWISNSLFWPGAGFDMVYKHQLDYWTPQTPDAYFARTYTDGGNNTAVNRRVQSKYLTNGAYLRLKNIQFGYNIPASLLEPIFVKRLRLFFSGENLLTLDHLPNGMEADLAVINSGFSYPFLKKYSFGVNISF